jgi:PAS domain S-box-containing protein
MSELWTGPEIRPGVNRAVASGFLSDVIEYAVSELLHDGQDVASALPEVLARLGAPLDCRCVLALEQPPGQPLTIIAAHPVEVTRDAALLTELSELNNEHRGAARSGNSFSEPLRWAQPLPGQPDGDVQLSVLMAYSPPADDHRMCLIAMVSVEGVWTADAHAASRAVAGIVAAQVRAKATEVRLREGQALTGALAEGSPNAVVVCGPDRRIVRINPAAETLFGYQPADLIGQDVAELLLPERKRAEFIAATQEYLDTGERGVYAGRRRYPMLRADGSERTVELALTPIKVDGVVHFCAFIRDISELDVAQAALTQSRERFRVVAKLAPVGILQLDGEGLCTYANDRWCELTGMTSQNAIGAGWADALHPDDAVRVEREWAVAAARATELRTDCRLITTDGDEVWADATAIPLLDTDGKPGGFVAAVTDVSGRKRAEAEREDLLAAERAARRNLAGQTERLNSLIDNAIPGILVRDEDGRAARLNQSWCDLFGVTAPAEQLAGATTAVLLDLLKPAFADADAFHRRFAELSSGHAPAEGQQFACRDGRTLEADYWPVRAGGDYCGDIWLFWDMTDRVAEGKRREHMLAAELAARNAAERAGRRLAEQNSELLKRDEAKSFYLATTSHEFRTPLTSIVSFSELILDGEENLSDTGRDSLGVIRRNADRLLRLVGDLLLLSSAETGVLPLVREDVLVPALIDEAIRVCSGSAADQQVSLEAKASDGPPLRADLLQLHQVLDNLLSNAIKFCQPGGQVMVTAVCEDQTWRIEVSDTGIGIPPGELDGLFTRFTRASNASGRSGNGLGLSIVKAITELHGGRVEAHSVMGQGTTITVYLPAGS